MAEKTASIERALFELNRDARTALGQGNLTTALEKLSAALALDSDSAVLWLNYAAARRRSGDVPGALEAVVEALKREPRSFNALLLQGALLEQAGDLIEAGRVYGVALLFKPQGALDEATAAAIREAEALHARYRAGIAAAIDRSVEALGREVPISQTARRFIDHAAGRAKIFTPQPIDFHVPGLASQEFFERDLFPWIGRLEEATGVIAQELEAAKRDRPDLFVPYVDMDQSRPVDQWAELNRSERWSALHVIQHGAVRDYAAALFPATLDALKGMPQPKVAGRTPNAMFSALTPRTRIPPHTGVTNARLVMHLPLVVPPGCGFRVGGRTREWEVGRAWVFDDTIEHEAWNDSDAPRIILIADLWNVFMSEADRKAYIAVVAALDGYHGAPTDQAL